MPQISFADVLALMLRFEELKRTARTGWNMEFPPESKYKTRRVPGAESVADHSWSLAMFALVVAPLLGLDVLKIVWMALIHDLAECITKDRVIAVLEGQARVDAKAAKRRDEDAAMRDIFRPYGDWGRKCYELWLDLEDRASPEARVLHELDKLEACIQAYAYERQGHVIDPIEFFNHAETEMIGAGCEELLRLLRARHTADQKTGGE